MGILTCSLMNVKNPASQLLKEPKQHRFYANIPQPQAVINLYNQRALPPSNNLDLWTQPLLKTGCVK